MKKLFLSFLILLTGCATYTLFHDNENCIGTREFKILQALDDGALAYECTVLSGCDITNRLVFLDWQPDVDYYDGLVVKTPSNKCAVQDGVFKYTNEEGSRKTVPLIRFDFKDTPKTEEDFAERAEDKRKRMFGACIHDSKIHDKKEDIKFCDCYVDQFLSYLADTIKKQSEFSDDKFYKLVKKKCNKLPKWLNN